MTERLGALERRTQQLATRLDLEIARTDWALGVIEGVRDQIADYHAYRESPEYALAFDTPEPLVSVCIATLDRAQLLVDRSIRSILDQTYQNLQVVVVGDACEDDTERRLAELGDSRIQFVNLAQRGPYPRPGLDRWRVAGSNAMNHALSISEGQFITQLDDDDAMVPHRIATLVKAAQRDRSDFLWHAFWYQNQDGTWDRLGTGRLERMQVTTGSVFFHHYFSRFRPDVEAFRLEEAGDWNRLRKVKLLRPRMQYLAEPLLYHHVERAQPPFVPRDGERFLD